VRTARHIIQILFVALFAQGANAGTISQVADKLLAKSPETAFEEAVAKDDLRLITIPFCDEAAPGFDFRSYKGERPINNDLGMSCRSLLGDDEMKALLRLEAWVGKYNSLVFKKLDTAK
jgi:hypothetical protein